MVRAVFFLVEPIRAIGLRYTDVLSVAAKETHMAPDQRTEDSETTHEVEEALAHRPIIASVESTLLAQPAPPLLARAPSPNAYQKRRSLILLGVATFALLFLTGFFTEGATGRWWINSGFVFCCLFALFTWLRYDSEEYHYRVNGILKAGMIFAFPLAFGYYLFQTRGAWGGCKAIFWMGLLVGLLTVVGVLGSLFGGLAAISLGFPNPFVLK
jgi:hypothetical protein